MIHRDVEIVDLDPLTWRHLGEIFPIGDWSDSRVKSANVLTILHQNGSVMTVDAPANIDVSTLPKTVSDPVALARKLYETYPGLTRVQIFDKKSLAAFSDAVQRQNWQKLTSGEYYLTAWQTALSDPTGLCFYPSGPERMEILARAKQLVSETPDNHHLILGVYDNGKPYFTLILKVVAKEITLVTTFDALVQFGLDTATVPSTAADEAQVRELVEKHWGPVSRAVFCNREELMALVYPNLVQAK